MPHCLFNIAINPFIFRSEISNLTEKVKRLEIAQANQRKQQAIAMAALAAEKLNRQKLNGEFQSDSNLTDPNRPNYNRGGRLVVPPGKRILLKVSMPEKRKSSHLDHFLVCKKIPRGCVRYIRYKCTSALEIDDASIVC